MNKILTRTAHAAVLFFACFPLCGCDDPAQVEGARLACMQNAISAGKVNSTNYTYWQQVCTQLATQGH